MMSSERLAAFGSMVMVILVIGSYRQTMCEADEVPSLAKQTLEARLLNVEQEAMENAILTQRVLKLLTQHRKKSFSELYDDPEKLAAEIDAAFDSIDDDVFTEDPQKRCDDLASTYGIVPQITWGDAPLEIRDEWHTLDCNSFT